MRWLVEFGADDQAKDNDGNTAMHHAVTNNNLKCAIWLQHFSNCDVRQINNRFLNIFMNYISPIYMLLNFSFILIVELVHLCGL